MSMKRIYLNEFNIVMGNTTYLPLVSGLLRAFSETRETILKNYEFMPFLFHIDNPIKILSNYNNPSVAAFSVSMWNEQLCLKISRELKNKWPKCLIVFGGPQVPHYPKHYFEKYSFIDVAVRGEGEEQFANILERFLISKNFEDLAGVSWRHPSSGNIIRNKQELPFRRNLDYFPSPYLDGLFDDLIAKITDKKFSVKGKINDLNLEHKEAKNIKIFLPSYSSKIVLKDSELSFNSKNLFELSGLIKFDENFNDFRLSGTSGKNFNFVGNINLQDLSIKIQNLNYLKEKNTQANIDFHINSSKSNYNIRELKYISEKSKIKADFIKLNKKFEIEDIKNIKITTFKNNIKNNDYHIDKHKKLKNTIFIKGKLFDAEPLLKSVYKTGGKKMLSKDFNSEIQVNLDKAITGTNDDVTNFVMIASIKKGSYDKLSLKGNFSEKEIIEMSIYQIDSNKKTLQVISDRARPFIKNFDFIKGFEGGKLEYDSIISKKSSQSNLLISDFKVSKVPALAKLFTLASLQGIADTLSGEGIRFDSFEMKSNSEGNIMNIEDALAMGPAVSILLNGYVDKGKTVSLRGTLVPATKLNSIIASIPLVGEILVGKKTGEGVVGVSFKMKGPPKNIKTSVNPIKTLTPRFIVRAVEKMKKQKKEEAK